jgi:P4 family phage/plasmid primase-like protien
LSSDEDNTKIQKITKFIDKMNAVAHRLGKTVEKKNIMTEAKELFYDPDFLDKLDANPYLLCFKNGVVDFKAKKFRPGTPEDYLSKCTGYDYTHVDVNEPNPVVDEVRDFMRKLFPLPRLHDYMWQHLAATLIGVLPNQTWNIYLGEGKNGKSVLVKLMEYVHGDYRGEMPVGVLTQDRGKIGGAMPEIVALKGLRLAVATEGRKGDCINDAVVKQLVSGIDAIQARGLYCAKMEVFYPQFDLVFMTNNLMKVKSNDFGTWRRIRVVPFMVLFTDNPVHDDPDNPYQVKIDRSIEHKLIGWKEVMASMLVDIAYQTEGVVTDCEEVLSASNAYRQSQDCLAEFINEELIQDNDPNSRITPAIVMHHFRTWYENNNYDRRDMPKTKELTAYLDKKFKRKQGKDWIGVRINFDAEQTEFIDNNDIPTY